MPSFFKFCTVILLFFGIQFAAVAQECSNMCVEVDQKISDLKRNSTKLLASGSFFQKSRELLDFINKSEIKPEEKYTRILRTAQHAISLQVESYLRNDLEVVEKRNIALFLIGTPLVQGSERYSHLRDQYSKTLVSYVAKLKSKSIKNYHVKPVFVNMSVDHRDDEKTRAEKHEEFKRNNRANNSKNRYQQALKSEISFLEPKVIRFLSIHYGENQSDRNSLDHYLKLMQ